MNETKPSGQEKGMNKPIVGLVIVMVVATLLGAWLYVQSVRNDLEMKINALSGQVSAATEAMPQEPASAPAAMTGEAKPFLEPIDPVWPYAKIVMSIPADWSADRQGAGVTGFYDAKGENVATLECSGRVENTGGMMDGATETTVDIDAGGSTTYHYGVMKRPTSNWDVYVDNQQAHSPSCLLSFDQAHVDPATYGNVVDSFTIVKE